MKKTLQAISATLVILVFSTLIYAQAEEAAKKFSLQGALGMVNCKTDKGTETLPKISASPDLNLGPISIGLDIEYIVAKKKKEILAGTDSGKNPIIVRFVEYNKDPLSARWGVLEKIKLGKGLIMNNYTTAATVKSAAFTNKDKGIKVGYKGDKYGATVLTTPSHVYGARLTYNLNPKLILGTTLVTDPDKTDDVSAYGVDVTVPLIKRFEVYSELATLQDKNVSKTGFNIGADFGLPSLKVMWKNEFRSFQEGFVPTPFDAHYEVASLDRKASGLHFVLPATTNIKNGFLSKLDFGLLEQYVKASIAYEDYKKAEPRLIGEANFDLSSLTKEIKQPGIPSNIKGTITYEEQNVRPGTAGKNGIIKAKITGNVVPKYVDVVINYLKSYQSGTSITSTTYDFVYKFPF